VYLNRIDSSEVMFDYVTEYISKHPAIAPAKEFKISDADFDDFKQRVIKSGFTYDRVSEKILDELIKTAKFEGYYEGAKQEFDNLKAKFRHDLAGDLERNKQAICEMIELSIIPAYYYQKGTIEAALRNDKIMKEAERLLANPDEYNKLLRPRKEK
jgi:carboxyl-terminal processing protease